MGKSQRGMTRDVWRMMVARCHDPSRKDYPRYGGRGVTVCPEWRDDFNRFVLDMGLSEPGKTIDRIDTNGDYEPGNCRWVTSKENNRNRGCTRFVIFRGKLRSVPDLAEEFNVELTALYQRLRIGWDIERAVTTPGTRGYFVRPSGRMVPQ